MYFIACRFQPKKYGIMIDGFAVCSDPNTPVTFILTDGSAYSGTDIHKYELLHFLPWCKLQTRKP